MHNLRIRKLLPTFALSVTLFALAQPGAPRMIVQPAAQQSSLAIGAPPKFPYAENLVYRVGWRMVTAGQATLRLSHAANNGWQLNLDLASLGLVNQLYRVLDSYKLSTSEKFCGCNVKFDAQEGKRRSTTTIDFDNGKHKLLATGKDLITNATHRTELDIPPCTYEIAGALMTLRASQLEPGMKFTLPVTDGKKLANVTVEGLGKENLTIKSKSYNTIRYETFVFDNVLYRRKGRLLLWVTDDVQRVPVQLRLIFGFPLGDITLELEKVERL
jgi:Protein of unknown function (DUF3108)